jgi:paraquat-inducible protein B
VIPDYRAARRWNIVWVVPIIALLIGGWMIWRNFHSQGPVAYIRFETADGIAAGKTEVRCRSVRVGVIRDVKLAEDLKSVLVMVELTPDSNHLLREGTNFWVVKPRASAASGVSGLGTLITGAYLELNPGPQSNKIVNHFEGLENPPATSLDVPGLRIALTAEEAGSLVAGSPIYYRGFEVGRIESRNLDIEGQCVIFDAFIREEYSVLVKQNTRFWNTSGIDVSAGADGFKLRTPSFQAMVTGGASFGVPEGLEPGDTIHDGATFTLFKDQGEAENSTFNPTMRFVLLFNQSVRGLAKSAPVEFRGIPIGRVADISFDYLQTNDDPRIPVLVEIDPSLLRREAAGALGQPDGEFLTKAIHGGLRAALKTGSLLTGAKFVDVDYYPESPAVEFGLVGEFPSIPTVVSGLDQLETQVSAILAKIQKLPLDETMKKIGDVADEAKTTVADARGALKEIEQTAASARKTLDSSEFGQLPGDLRSTLTSLEKTVSSVGPDGSIQGDMLRTMEELRAALRAMQSLATSIDDKPNSLLFGRESSGNPIPKAPKRR